MQSCMSLQAQPRRQNKSAHPREYALSKLVNEFAEGEFVSRPRGLRGAQTMEKALAGRAFSLPRNFAQPVTFVYLAVRLNCGP